MQHEVVFQAKRVSFSIFGTGQRVDGAVSSQTATATAPTTRGRVVRTLGGQGVAGALVVAKADNNNDDEQATTDASGAFRIRALQAGAVFDLELRDETGTAVRRRVAMPAGGADLSGVCARAPRAASDVPAGCDARPTAFSRGRSR